MEQNPSLEYDRAEEVKQFDDTKTGVRGLVESGVTKVPRFLIHPPHHHHQNNLDHHHHHRDQDQDDDDDDDECQVPVIDLGGREEQERRGEIVRGIREAAETWGIFKMVNHGVPERVMEEMLEGVRRFHEQPKEMRKEWYSRDPNRRVKYYCNGNLLEANNASWRDSISFDLQDGPLDPRAFPSIFRKEVEEYIKHMAELREALTELMSEALGLSKDYLGSIECMKTENLVCHYYPACPEPELTQGTINHSDPSSLTILLQDHMGGLQVIRRNRWVDVTPSPGVLIANIGDFMQLITNDKFKSVEHRVLSRSSGARISVACFLYPSQSHKYTPYGPIKEFLSQKQLPNYRDTHISDYLSYYRINGTQGYSALPHFKLHH